MKTATPTVMTTIIIGNDLHHQCRRYHTWLRALFNASTTSLEWPRHKNHHLCQVTPNWRLKQSGNGNAVEGRPKQSYQKRHRNATLSKNAFWKCWAPQNLFRLPHLVLIPCPVHLLPLGRRKILAGGKRQRTDSHRQKIL